MQAPVSMLKGIVGKGSTSAVLALLFGLAVIAMVSKAPAASSNTPKPLP